MSVRFTVLLPVHRPPELLPFAIETALAQSLADFELFVVCDGAPAETGACARSYAARDPRVRVFEFPKGERFGEAHRHAALAEASGEFVAHIADDDLWLPDHLAEMDALLRDVDFGHVIHVHVHAGGRLEAIASDLRKPELRRRMCEEPYNRFGLSSAGYRLAAYRRLPDGWTPAPVGIWTDLHMWRKFLRRDDMRFGTRMAVTALCFQSVLRKDVPIDERAHEVRQWHERIRNDRERKQIVETAWRSLVVQSLEMADALAAVSAAQAQCQRGLADLRDELQRMTQSRG